MDSGARVHELCWTTCSVESWVIFGLLDRAETVGKHAFEQLLLVVVVLVPVVVVVSH